MKIEKVNDNQIRCTLTSDDLSKRSLKISELAYGTDKAKILFRDMMRQASIQFGFDAENMPLMIEAIPLNSDCIVLVVTKVEDPEELDTRFSNFSPSVQNEAGGSSETEGGTAFEKLLEAIRKGAGSALDTSGAETASAPALPAASARDDDSARQIKQSDAQNMRRYMFCNRLFVFDSLNRVIEVSGLVSGALKCYNALYSNPDDGRYYLVLVFDGMKEVTEAQSSLALLSEYGKAEIMTYAREQYLREHCEVLCADHAIEQLSAIAGK